MYMVTFEEVADAARRLTGIAHRTPVVTSRTLDEVCGNRMFLKCENLQRIGAFKFRGAYNAISRLTEEEKARGVVT
jgi:threonine dehydratase